MKLGAGLASWRPRAKRRAAVATSVFADTLQAGEIWEKRRRSATRYAL